VAGDASADAEPGPFVHWVRVWSSGGMSDEQSARNPLPREVAELLRRDNVFAARTAAAIRSPRRWGFSSRRGHGHWSETTNKIAKLASETA
jgi:hypothetical protein